jgi:quinohemoprotein ethanol dehydrogenase
VSTADVWRKLAPLWVVGVLISSACDHAAPPGEVAKGHAAALSPARVDSQRLAEADAGREAGQWLTPGRDGAGTYYSPLDAINDQDVDRLGFAWDYKLGTRRGLEATPVVVDGVMYAVGNFGRVYALDAATGRERWTYDPHVDGQWGRYACCDAVSRGLAVWKGRVFVVSLDGYLHAIDAASGRLEWRVDTLPYRSAGDFHYFVTGAPVLAGGSIVIGNGGSDFKGARGSVSAYSLETGAFEWRFFTVPRDPRLGPQDQPHLDAAVKTWPANYDWSMGGGGTAWDGIAYDPDQRLVYFGTGNGSPYHGRNDAQSAGDQLFVASIVAVHVDTGKLAWHFQEIPGEGWDYDTTNKLVLADGGPRRVIMQASKNGFLYVLDRATGEFLSGKQYAHVNWTRGLDPVTHRPVVSAAADWGTRPALLIPGAVGAHGWQPMSFDPKTHLVYIPVIDAAMVYVDTSKRRAGLIEGNFDLAFFFPEDYQPRELQSLYGKLPAIESLTGGGPPPTSRGLIRAVEPVTGKIVWEQQTASRWDGGVLTTGGNLVVQGDAAGFLSAYAADSGKLLKRIEIGTSIMAAPMTYRIDGVQYVSVMAGFGGGLLFLPFPEDSAAFKFGNEGRILTFKLDGGSTPIPPRVDEAPSTVPPAHEGTAATISQGELLYNRYCSRCHTFGRGLLPDLRRLSSSTNAIFYEIVLRGAYQVKGMGRWDDVISGEDAAAIHAYLVDEAWKLERSLKIKPTGSAP